MNNSIFERIQAAIGEATSILVTSHRDADGDSIGSQLAILDYLKDRGKEAVSIQCGPPPQSVSFLPNLALIKDISTYQPPAGQSFDLALILECPTMERAGRIEKLFTKDMKLINIDHHKDNAEYGDIMWVDPEYSSVGEMLCDFFKWSGFEFGGDTAQALYTAILTDTGRFRFNAARANTFRVTANLLDKGINIQELCDHIYFAKSQASLELTGLALSNIRFAEDGKVCLIPVSKAMYEKTGAVKLDSEGIVDYTLQTASAQLGALLKEDENSVRVSLRSRGEIDVAAIANSFGGGGHRNAAGLTLETTLKDALEIIEKRLVDECRSKK